MDKPSKVNTEIRVLLIDDQVIVYEALKDILTETSIKVFFCQDPQNALQQAYKVKPTVILLDLIMPNVDGLVLLKYIKSDSLLREIPLIVLSSKEEGSTKAKAFEWGANDYLVKLPQGHEMIARLKYHSRSYIYLLERNEAYKRLVETQNKLDEELSEASSYVYSLLPDKIKTPNIEIDWRFIPSKTLGGDIFNYQWIDDQNFVFYLVDVCGHGIGSALLSVSVLNYLQSLSLQTLKDPVLVMDKLNRQFPMEKHDDMFFTIWYGLWNRATRILCYANAGHPPPITIGSLKGTMFMKTLRAKGMVIGAMEEAKYNMEQVHIPNSTTLFVFSDGVFEIDLETRFWTYGELSQYLLDNMRGSDFSLAKLLKDIKKMMNKDFFDDDFSILQLLL